MNNKQLVLSIVEKIKPAILELDPTFSAMVLRYESECWDLLFSSFDSRRRTAHYVHMIAKIFQDTCTLDELRNLSRIVTLDVDHPCVRNITDGFLKNDMRLMECNGMEFVDAIPIKY